MGHIVLSRQAMVDNLTETVGYKAGIVVSEAKLPKLLKDYDAALAKKIGDDTHPGFRFHSSEVQNIVAHLLYKVGNIDDPSTVMSTIQLYHRVKDSPYDLACYHHVMECYSQFMKDMMKNPPSPGTALDPEKFMRASMDPFGTTGLDMAMDVIKGLNRDLHVSPWGQVRATDWTDAVELENLFKSESLETQYGKFFDQRFIDFLKANYDEIGNIHWRKFEGLAGEYFDREGFKVDIGPGRNDDGIDLRVYPAEAMADAPPLIIVQCKRQKEKIGKALIKSVYADVLHEKAESGLVVTSSFISPGADEMKTARNYPIETADRDTLKEWIEKMKTERI